MRMSVSDVDGLCDALQEIDPAAAARIRQSAQLLPDPEDADGTVYSVEVNFTLRQTEAVIAYCDRVEQAYLNRPRELESDGAEERCQAFERLRYFVQRYRGRLQGDSMHLKTRAVFEDLSQVACLGGKLTYLREGAKDNPCREDCIRADFHKYLSVIVEVADNWTCVLSSGAARWKVPLRKLIPELERISRGDVVFVERTGPLRRLFGSHMQRLPREEFEQSKSVLCAKPRIRIYDALGLIYEA